MYLVFVPRVLKPLVLLFGSRLKMHKIIIKLKRLNYHVCTVYHYLRSVNISFLSLKRHIYECIFIYIYIYIYNVLYLKMTFVRVTRSSNN